MWKHIGYERCLAFVNCQLRPGAAGVHSRVPVRPAITISRMTGAGGRTIASELVEYLEKWAPVDCHWTVFDRNLLEKVLEEHHLPRRIAEYMPENHKPMLGDMVEELLGLHPSSWTLVHQTSRTILRLAQMGYVILVGRGANVITATLDSAFHVRLVGSVQKRAERMQELYDVDRHQAEKLIEEQDKGRRRYLKEHFHRDIDDPLLYHLVINTDQVAYDAAARLIGDEVINRFHLERRAEAAAV